MTEGTIRTLVRCCTAIAATPWRMLRPRRPSPALLSRIQDAGVQPARNEVRLIALTQALNSGPAAVIAEGVRRPRRLDLCMTTFLVEHPQARFLVDPSMCADVFEVVLPQLPAPIRGLVAPDKPVTGLADVLGEQGLEGSDVDFALPTHLHWDHTAGLLELPADLPVRVVAVEREWALGGAVAPLGVARGPLAGRTFDDYELDGPPVLTFERSHDLFGDGSVVVVDLAGHTPGSIGVLLAVDDGSRVLLAGDAIWHGLQAELAREKAPFPGNLTDDDRDLAFATVQRLHALPKEIELIASHDRSAAANRHPKRPD